MFKHFGLFVLVLALLVSLVPISNSQPQPKNGDISFLPNVIPDLVVTDRPDDKPESFRFEWFGNRFDIEVFFNATYERKGVNETRLFSLLDFEDDFEVSVEYVAEKNGSHCQFGWLVEGVSEVSEVVHNAWFKIEDTNPFDYEDIELETIEPMPPDFNYTITRFHLPDNLVLSFEDLYHKGFVIGWQNKTATNIKGFSGKSSWNLDPITFSSNVMTMTAVGSAGSWANELFWRFWDASNTNGWAVAEKTGWGENTQFTFGCRLQIGNGTEAGACYVYDLNKHVYFNTSAFSAGWQIAIKVKNYAHIRLGTLIDGSTKRTKQGVDIILNTTQTGSYIFYTDSTGSEIFIYSCHFNHLGSAYPVCLESKGTVQIYHSVFDNGYVAGSYGTDNFDIYDLVMEGTVRYGLLNVEGTLEEVYSHSCYAVASWQSGEGASSIRNVIGKVNAYAVFAQNIVIDHELVNADIDTWNFYWYGTSTAEVYRQYEHTFNFTYNINPVENANVTITYEGQGGGKIGSWQTWANGSIPTQTISRSFYNQTGGNTEYAYYPYVLTVTLDGYQTYTKKWTPTEKTTWEIALTPTDTSFNSTYYLLGAITLSPFILLGLYWRKKKNGNRI